MLLNTTENNCVVVFFCLLDWRWRVVKQTSVSWIVMKSTRFNFQNMLVKVFTVFLLLTSGI
jgi:hypothetical protein